MSSPKFALRQSANSWLAVALCSGALLLSGCSSSGGDPDPSGVDALLEDGNDSSDPSIDSSAMTGSDTATAGDQDTTESEQDTAGDNNDVAQFDDAGTSDDTGTSDVVIGDNNTPEQPIGGNQPDPISPVSTVVDFQITVPAYMSNRLQLVVTWGSKELATQWMGDELWSASDTFPTNSKQPLVVTFSDNNGDIVLGVYETDYQTGINASEVLEISAEQFDTEQWDDDGDGVSNLSESIAGFNPLIVEAAQLDIVDTYYELSFGNATVLANLAPYEEKLTELPYYEESTESESIPAPNEFSFGERKRTTILIDIDANGTGTFTEDYLRNTEGSNTTTIEEIADRTNTGESINYGVTYERFNTSAAVGEYWGITADTQALDNITRTQTGELYSRESGTGRTYREDTTYTLTGSVIEGLSLCEPSYGVLTYKLTRSFRVEPNLTTVSKGVDDQYWNVSVTTPEGSVVEAYLARGLGKVFYCEFVGL